MNPTSEQIETLIARHASLMADAEKSESKSRAHNLRTKASGIGEAIALLMAAVSEGTPQSKGNNK